MTIKTELFEKNLVQQEMFFESIVGTCIKTGLV